MINLLFYFQILFIFFLKNDIKLRKRNIFKIFRTFLNNKCRHLNESPIIEFVHIYYIRL